MSHQALRVREPVSVADLAAAIDDILCRTDGAAVAAAVGGVLARFAGDPDLLSPGAWAPRVECYARNLLHADPAGRFSIWVMVWAPGQGSAIHDHSCWCVMGGHAGRVTESTYRPVDAKDPYSPVVTCGEAECGPGDVRALHPGIANIHRIHNAGKTTAVSIHVYGFDPALADSSVGRTYCSR